MPNPSSQIGNKMSTQESQSFLARNDTAVLSMGVENRGYGFPISYTYDGESDRIILGFVTPPESKKREFATTTEEATITVYIYEEIDSWKSVIATGPIRPIDEDESVYRLPDLFFNDEGDDASQEAQIVHLDEFERTLYELQIDTISGLYSGG